MTSRLVAVVGILLSLPSGSQAQYPTDMLYCFNAGQLEACLDVSAGTLIDPFCPSGPRVWEAFFGRLAWYPLEYAAPIVIEVDARRTPSSRFPIYIEYVPLKDRPDDLGFCDGPGDVIAVVWGGPECDSPWERFGPIILPLDVGDLYFIRAFWVGDNAIQHHAYMNCIRVTAQVAPSAVETRTWGRVKHLYR